MTPRILPKLSRLAIVEMSAPCYFLRMLEHLLEKGFELARIDPDCRQAIVYPPKEARGWSCRHVIRVYSCGNRTMVAFGVERTLLSSIFAGKQQFVDMLTRMEALLLGAASAPDPSHNDEVPVASWHYARHIDVPRTRVPHINLQEAF